MIFHTFARYFIFSFSNCTSPRRWGGPRGCGGELFRDFSAGIFLLQQLRLMKVASGGCSDFFLLPLLPRASERIVAIAVPRVVLCMQMYAVWKEDGGTGEFGRLLAGLRGNNDGRRRLCYRSAGLNDRAPLV